jgi:O-antigen ligase
MTHRRQLWPAHVLAPAVADRLQVWSSHVLALVMAVAVLAMFVPRPWINPTLFQAGLFLLGGVWAAAMVVRPFAVRFSLPMIPLACAVAWGVLQLAAHWTGGRASTGAAVLVWLGNLVAFFLAMQACGTERVRRLFLDSLLWFAFVLSVVSVVQYFSWDGRIFWLFPTSDSAALGPFVNRDQYAAFIEMTLPLALVQALGGGPRAMGMAVVSAAMYASVIAGASRAGALLVTAEIVVVPLLLWASGRAGRNSGRTARNGGRTAAIHVWLLALVFVAVVGWAVLWSRFQDPDPLSGRREMLASTVAMVRARPWTGFGLGTFRTVYPAYASLDFGAVVQHAHNDWAEWAADGGIPFSLLLAWIALWSIRKALRTVWGIGLVAVFVHGVVDFPLQKPVLELWLFGLLGVLAAEPEATARADLRA